MSYDQNLADCEAALADVAATANDQSRKLAEANLEILSWKARAEQNYAEWEAANQLLEQTIEVLEGLMTAMDFYFVHEDGEGERRARELFESRQAAYALLDNLKALKKEGAE